MTALAPQRSLVWVHALAVAACAFLPALAAAQDGRPEVDLWPVFYYDKASDGKSSVTEILWPFIEGREDTEWKQSFFRPFWNRREEKGQEFKETEFLWPFGRITQRGSATYTTFFPFRFRTEETKEDGEKEVDDIRFPFLFKHRQKGDNYTAIFPFFGHIKDRFGRDEIKFVMWPIYTWQRKDDVTATTILWPFISFSSYPGGGGFKLWPLFGSSEKKGTFKKSFILWPFYNYQWAQLKSGGTYECTVMFLIMGKERSPAGKADSILWPFFMHTENFKTGVTEDWYPWPLFGKGRGKDYTKDQYLPFFSTTKEGGTKDDAILWPIATFTDRQTADSHYTSARVLPLWYDVKEEWPKDKSRETYFHLWPLFHTSKKRNGVEKTESLSPIWLRENDGWERNWAPFFWLFQTGKDKDGVRYDHFLHRVYRHESGKDYGLLELKPLFRIWQKEGQSELALLHVLRFSTTKKENK